MRTLRLQTQKSNPLVFFVILSAVLVLLSLPMTAQNVAALTGVVTDQSGAAIVGADVKLVDTKTNTSYQTVTNSAGIYTFLKLLPGPAYTLTVSKEGFQSTSISNIYVAVDATHTQNAQLSVGKATETVEVNGTGSQVSLDTTDTTVSSTMNMGMVHELPLNIRDSPLGLLVYTPGVVRSAAGDDNTLGSRDGAVSGARADQSNYTLDGMDTNDFGTGESFVMTANAPMDSVQEVRTESANPLSEEGRGSGAQVQVVTKSGTNTWHGSAYEYNRTAATTANNFFNVRNGIPRAPLTRNQFGASLGGPAIHDKLFFFFNYEGRRDARADSVEYTVPLDNFRAGNVGYINNNAGCTFHSRQNTTPNCIGYVLATDTSLDPAHVGPDPKLLTFINQRYPHANDLTQGDGVNTGGFIWNAPAHRAGNDYVSRIDYNLSSKMKLFGRVSIYRSATDDDQNFASAELFPGDPVSNKIIDHSWAFVIGHTWTISNNKINQFNFGETRSILDFPSLFNPTGTTQYSNLMSSATNTPQITSPFPGGASQGRTVPIPVFKDDFTYVRGNHNFQVGGTFKPIKDNSKLVNDFNDVTIGLGNPVLSLEGQIPAEAPANILTPSGTADRDWSQAYAFALGRIASVNSTYNNAHDLSALPQGTGHIRNYRYYETELYLQDLYRVNSHLSVNYGLRWQYYSVPYEVNGFETLPNIDFASMYKIRAANGAAGVSGDTAAPPVLYNFGGKANHAPGYFHPDWRDFAPRLGFSYNPSFTNGLLGGLLGNRKTVIRGGAGIVFDHTIMSAINFFNDQSSFVFGQSVGTVFQNGLGSDPRFSDVGGLGGLPTLNPPQPATVPAEPYLNPPGSFFKYNGLVANLNELAVDPSYKTPYAETITFGIQRELPGNFFFETTYVGRFGHRLLSRGDAGQVVDFKDTASGQRLVNSFSALSLQDRNGQALTTSPWFENQMTSATQNNFGTDCPGYGVSIAPFIFGGPINAVNCTDLMQQVSEPLLQRGDMGDNVELLYAVGLLNPNVGLDPQFSSQLYFGNKSYSNYNGLLTSLHKRLSHGLQFDINYTYSHSIDNSSTIANNATGTNATGGYGGFLCDAIQLRSCRGNSDFDVTHLVSADGLYDLPIGKGRWLGSNASGWLNQIIGGWQVAFLNQWRTGFAFTTVTEAFPVSFNANSPAVFIGTKNDIKVRIHNDSNGQVQLFADPNAALNAFTGPIGLQGPTRNNLRGPRLSNTNLSLNKHFQIRENYGLEFRAEAYNAFNQVNFALPIGSVADINNQPTFGVINSAAGAREMQFSLRIDF